MDDRVELVPFQVTPKEWVRYAWFDHWRRQKWIAIILALAGAIAVILNLGGVWPLGVLLILEAPLLWWISITVRKSRAARYFADEFKVCVEGDEFSTVTRSGSSSRLKLAEFQTLVETGPAFALVTRGGQHVYIPKRAFASPEDQARFKSIVQRGIET